MFSAAVFVTLVLVSGCRDYSDQGRGSVSSARKLCAQAARVVGESAVVVEADESTAGEVAADAKSFGEPTDWDGLAADHRVARCTIIDVAAQEAGSTTVCEDGSHVALESLVQVVVDNEGRSTPEPGADFTEAAGLSPC